VPEKITAYRVFIASPGGLEDEREHFRAVIDDYNATEAIERGVIFLPVGWEITLGGVGRPQHVINEDVRRCDYFLLVLWDRWGSSPGKGDGATYTSGSEEEFGVAKECYESKTMRNLVILFKDVDPSKLRDPGPELSKVLKFKESLESEKQYLYETFDEQQAFGVRLRSHLGSWMRAHEKGTDADGSQPTKIGAFEGSAAAAIDSPASAPDRPASQLVQAAEQYAREGQITAAEQAFARALPQGDLDTLSRYGAFLRAKGSLAGAERAFTQLRALARERGQRDWEYSAASSLGRVYEAQQKHDEAATSFRAALELREQTLGPDHPDIAVSLNELAEFYSARGKFDLAEPLFVRALKLGGIDVGG
jgi:tetratricopeptide (TPR) repeat protein